jgi:T-complex protein 1 subunit zeta
MGVWDSFTVKKQTLNLSTVLATQLLLVDEVMKAGKAMGKQPAQEEE